MKTTHGSMRPLSAAAPTAKATLQRNKIGSSVTKNQLGCVWWVGHIRDGREHALVYGEKKVGDFRATDRWNGKEVLESNVLEVSDIAAGAVRER